jgi:hypothetical protein
MLRCRTLEFYFRLLLLLASPLSYLYPPPQIFVVSCCWHALIIIYA